MKSISTADNLSTASLDEQVSSPLKVEYIPREYISPDPEQVRKQFSQEHIERLRESFSQIGIRTPLDVVQMQILKRVLHGIKLSMENVVTEPLRGYWTNSLVSYLKILMKLLTGL